MLVSKMIRQQDMSMFEDARKNETLIFVFGSNLRGAHGAGAAAHAEDHWGAKRGHGVGLAGRSYAIPTKDASINTMPLKAVRPFVEDFKEFAKENPELVFQVTQIGCGLAGYSAGHIAPMFVGSPENCWFDANWYRWIGDEANYWGTF